MSVLSKALRFAVLVSLVNGCAPRNSATTESWNAPTESYKAQGPADTLSAAPSAAPGADTVAAANTSTEQLLNLADAGIDIQMQRGTGYTKLLLAADATNTKYEVNQMNQPARLVIDLLGAKATANRSVSLSGNDYVNSIRVGKHTDRTRVVLDLTETAGNQGSTYQSVDREGDKIAVTFRNATTPAAEVAAIPATAQPVQEIVEARAPKNIDSSANVRPDAAATLASVESVRFYKTKGTAGEVTVAVNGKAPYSLKKTAATEYSLQITGATAGEGAKLPQIAPVSAPGIRSTRTVQDGNDVLVRMFVDPGIELRAFSRGSEIMVVANAANTTTEAQEARGQMKPEEAAKPAEAAPAADASAPSEAAADAGNGEVALDASGDETARRNPTGIPSADGSKIYTGRLISLDLQETDIDNALRIIAEVSNLNIIASDDVTGKVTLRLVDVPWDQALDVILKTNGLDQVTEGNVIRIAPVDKLRQEREALREAKKAAENLEDLKIEYKRISYAKATDLKEQVEAVLSERGSVAIDERTNQLIIKDINKGQDSARDLIKKLDLRTPQVLLETQVVEASRSLLRDLGFQWNFAYSQSPATGNATGYNFPNSIVAGGGTSSSDGSAQAVNFPAALGSDAGSAIAAVLDSADGSRLLSMRLSALEQEGRVKVISRPQVATVNNKEAQIKSVETVRVRLPDSGLSVATGQGASAQGGGSSAFEEIDVGITLRVTPQASPDYYVLLDIYAKSSTFGDKPVDNIPSTREREATSTILVKSGQTFALGGVYRISEKDQMDGLPFLKDVPVLGHFFRRTLADKGDEELIFFITPHIVEGSFDPSLM